MGLDVSHDCWHGAYSAFMKWREKLAEVAGLPPLTLMDGFYKYGDVCGDPVWMAKYADKSKHEYWKWESIQGSLPIKWSSLKRDVLHKLLFHSDCDGILEVRVLLPLAKRLEELIPLLPDEDAGGHIGNWREKTKQFADGLRRAAEAHETVRFF